MNVSGTSRPPPLLERRSPPSAAPCSPVPPSPLQVFPSTWSDRLSINSLCGLEMETWIQPGKPATQGRELLGEKEGGIAVVLAAGNQSFLAVMDAVEQLFKHGRVVVLKYHDLQEPVTPSIEALLEPLVKRGFLWGVHADIEVASALVYHPLTTHVHMTGGNATHDSIVWGPPGPERAKRMEQGKPLLKVPITSELGNISPWIVAPGGAWSEKELTHHVKALTEAVVNNSGANCLAAKVVLLADSWEHTNRFMEMLRAELRSVAPLPPFYPGSLRRAEEFREHHPEAEVIFSESDAPKSRMGVIPISLLELRGLPGSSQSDYCLTVEPFSPTLTVIRIPADGTEDFLSSAVSACNTRIWGNLTATLIVHPDVEKEHRPAVETAIADLEYGLVAVNVWGVLGFTVESGHWGGFVGNQTLQSPQSGIGSVHNLYMYDYPQKSVLRTPFVCGLHLLHDQSRQVSPKWFWRIGRLLAGSMVNGVSGALSMLFSSGRSQSN